MQFRAYYIDRHEHVRGAIDIKASGEVEALACAERMRSASYTIELWSGDAFLRRFDRRQEEPSVDGAASGHRWRATEREHAGGWG